MSTAVISSARPARVHKLAVTQFDYNTVPASIRSDLQAQAKLIKKLIAKTTADLIDLGRHLIAAKQHIGHGLFIPWVEGEIGISGRTAQRYMAIAQLAEAKNDSVSLLPPTILHRLAAPSAPLEVVDYVIGQANGRRNRTRLRCCDDDRGCPAKPNTSQEVRIPRFGGISHP